MDERIECIEEATLFSTCSCSSITRATCPAIDSSLSSMAPTHAPLEPPLRRWYRLGSSWREERVDGEELELDDELNSGFIWVDALQFGSHSNITSTYGL